MKNLADRASAAMLYATTALLGAAVFYSCPPAHADISPAAMAYAEKYAPAVCATLDEYPSFDGIIGIGKSIVKDGLTPPDAGVVIGLSIDNVCPRHEALLQRFIDTYAPPVAKQRVA